MKNKKIQILINGATLRNICGRFLDFEVHDVVARVGHVLQFNKMPENGKKLKATIIPPGSSKPRELGKVLCKFTREKHWLFIKVDKKEKNTLYLSAPIGESFKKVELPTPKILAKVNSKKKPVKK